MTPEAIAKIAEAGPFAVLVLVLVAVGVWINRYTNRQQDFIERLVQRSNELTSSQVRAMEDMASAIRETARGCEANREAIIAEIRGLGGKLGRNAHTN